MSIAADDTTKYSWSQPPLGWQPRSPHGAARKRYAPRGLSATTDCYSVYSILLRPNHSLTNIGMSAVPCLRIRGLMTSLGVKVLFQAPRFVFLPQHNRDSFPGVVQPFQRKLGFCRDDGQGLFHSCRIGRKGHSISAHEPPELSPQLACFDKAIAVSLSS
jgi:hypothetical protein